MDVWHILDFSAVINHCINSGEGADFEYDEISGRKVNTAEHGFSVFIDEYITPILQQARPDQVIVCHDGGCDYREYIYPDYKKKRKEQKQAESAGEYARQLEKCKHLAKQFLAAMGILQAHVKGVEGDDLIAYMCQGLQGGKRIYSVDADLLQLCDNSTQLFLKNVWVNPTMLDESSPNLSHYLYGLLGAEFPRYVTLYKSLVGDTSDEYKGVPGFGESKFTDMVNEIGHDGLDELIQAVTDKQYLPLNEAVEAYCGNPPRWLKLITGSLPEWRTSWLLAQLHPELCEKPWRKQITKIDWYKRVPDNKRLRQALRNAKALDMAQQFIDYMPNYWLVDATNFEETDIAEFTELCKQSPCVAFDYEGYDDNYPQFQEAANGRGHVDVTHSRPTGVSFCVGPNLENCFYITVEHADSNNLPKDVIRRFLEAVPEGVPLVAQNSAYEMEVTQNQLGLVLEDVHDTMIMANYVDENDLCGLKHLSKRWLGYDQATYEETIAKARKPNATMKDLTADQVLSYGIDDSVVTAHLYQLFRIIMMLEHTWGFYAKNEPLATNVLVDGHRQGVVLDWEKLACIKAQDELVVTANMAKLRDLLEAHCGEVDPQHLADFIRCEKPNWVKEVRHKANLMPEERFEELGKPREVVIADMIEQALNAKNKKYGELGSYEPYRESFVYPEFKPTLKTFEKVCEKVGLPPMASVAKSRIGEWTLSVGAFDFEAEKPALTEEQQQFVDLVNGAVDDFKTRAGRDYDKLAEFCNARLERKPKVVKHGSELNTNSPQQMQAMIYIMLGFPVRLRTKPQMGSLRQTLGLEGAPATDDIAIKTALAEDCQEGDWRTEALHCINLIKESETRLSLYHRAYPLWRHPDTDLIYPSIRNFGTVTGRPTGSAPNILQVSKHQQDGVMRSVYLPRRRDHCIVAIDFAGQELRILASVSRDRNLLSAYIGEANAELVLAHARNSHQGELEFTAKDVIDRTDLRDVHSMTASGMTQVFGLPQMDYRTYIEAYEDIKHELHQKAAKIRRRPAKQTNFLLAYGGGAGTLAIRLIIPEKEADAMMSATHRLYSGIAKWQKASGDYARQNGYTMTAYGKRRHATNDVFSKDGGKRARAERQLNNSEIQGCAADILKKVLSDSWRQRVWQETGAIMLAPVYDEIVASVPIVKAIEYIRRMVPIMNVTPPGQPVPMLADVSVGHNWQAQRELGMKPTDEAIQAALDEIKPLVEAKWDTLEGKYKEEAA